MNERWRAERLPELVRELASRPGHERLRVLIEELLRESFGARFADIEHETWLPEVRGRADMLFGATVIELKSDLRRERDDVLARLPDYLAERERRTHRRYLGLATDGAIFLAFERRDGALVEIGRHETDPKSPAALLAWLEPALSDRDDLIPDPVHIRRELGRESLTWARARAILEKLWASLREHSEVKIKRDLWNGLLREAYGAQVGDDALFLQHTYLTIVAKTLAARVLDLPADDPETILSGRALAEVGILGAVESDFFDWLLLEPEGRDLVARVARQVRRFRLHDLEVDVLKALYESLIDPTQRHDLGEYYTPDWLAERIVREVVREPLTMRVLDPACGSGTFLFHAVRRLLEAAKAAGWPEARAVREAAERVRGLDVHPVAVIIARVTWLLALGEAVKGRKGELHVPVYLGDALQWNLEQIGGVEEVLLPVPGEGPLYIPASVAADHERFEAVLRILSEGQERLQEPGLVGARLSRLTDLLDRDREELVRTYARLLKLAKENRDRIWPFVLRNLVRPVWLSRPDQRADVVVGNPPWVTYRYLSPDLKERFRAACQSYGIWVGGVFATQQDTSALFWARAAERYLAPGGTIAFVMPWAALNGPAFAPVRKGELGPVRVVVTAAWSLEELRELFPNASCVLFGRRDADPAPLPTQVLRFRGHLPRR
ncbi:MAG: N-6 DNA methylase, partial [Geminicoccaceae bacterium]|nr:N-6 DNA methylase [Geminicoccaceae bacterium]